MRRALRAFFERSGFAVAEAASATDAPVSYTHLTLPTSDLV